MLYTVSWYRYVRSTSAPGSVHVWATLHACAACIWMCIYIYIYIHTFFSLSLCAVNIILQHIVILFHPMNIAFLQYIYAHKQFLKNVYAFICLCATTHLHMFTHGYAYRICWPYVSASNKESMKNKHDMNKMTRITVDLYTVCIYICGCVWRFPKMGGTP